MLVLPERKVLTNGDEVDRYLRERVSQQRTFRLNMIFLTRRLGDANMSVFFNLNFVELSGEDCE